MRDLSCGKVYENLQDDLSIVIQLEQTSCCPLGFSSARLNAYHYEKIHCLPIQLEENSRP